MVELIPQLPTPGGIAIFGSIECDIMLEYINTIGNAKIKSIMKDILCLGNRSPINWTCQN